jgi:hypothetical protein
MPKKILSNNDVQDEFVTLMNSCEEGYTGTWDPTGEGRDGFEAMYQSLKKLAVHFKVDISKAKEL